MFGLSSLDRWLLSVRPAWQRDALCSEPEYRDVNFFPERGESAEPARQVRARCLVADECLRFALEAGPDVTGLWGETSGRDRRTMALTTLSV